MHPKFDRLFLSIPSEFVSINDIGKFTVTVTGDGEPLRYKYEQTHPFYYKILIDDKANVTKVEFSGKALMEEYPALIDATNITTCIDNINACHVCNINWTEAYPAVKVMQCDVTSDVHSDFRIPELYSGMIKRTSRDWQIESYTSTRFAIENTAVTRRYRSRMVIYDKEAEIQRSCNAPFLDAVTNSQEQLAYFQKKIRFELNLNSMNRIRKYLKVDDTTLSSVLSSQEDPIGTFLAEATVARDPLQNAIAYSTSLRMLEHILLATLCGFDMERIEGIVRDLYSQSSARKALKPYQDIVRTVRHNIPDIDTNMTLSDIRTHLRYMLSVCMPGDEQDPRNLQSLYHSPKSHVWIPQGGDNWGYCPLSASQPRNNPKLFT